MLTIAEISSCAVGRFTRRALMGYLTFISVTFWSVIFLAWLMYPWENSYSIMTHTFSFLGSYDEKHNPEWWWIFSIAMLFWCFSAMPVVLYIYRHFTGLTLWGARLGAALLLTGCVHIGLVGIFPDARGMVFGVARGAVIACALYLAVGLLVEPEDPRAMAAALTRLLGDEALRAEFAERGRRLVLESFRIEHTVEQIERVWDEMLVAGRPQPVGAP